MVFPNLEAEMARSKITQAKLAEILGVTPTTLSFKLNRKQKQELQGFLMLLSRSRHYLSVLSDLLRSQVPLLQALGFYTVRLEVR